MGASSWQNLGSLACLGLSMIVCLGLIKTRTDLSQIDRESKGANVIAVRQIKAIKFIISGTIQAT